MVICDIDDFKKIDNRFSHQMGDAVLKAVARLVANHPARRCMPISR